MVTINFKCKRCGKEFDCEVGKIQCPPNIGDPLIFEKDLICPNCGVIGVKEAEFTEWGQTQMAELFFNGEIE